MGTQSIESLLAQLSSLSGRGALIGTDAETVKSAWVEIESRVGGREKALALHGRVLTPHFREIIGIRKAA